MTHVIQDLRPNDWAEGPFRAPFDPPTVETAKKWIEVFAMVTTLLQLGTAFPNTVLTMTSSIGGLAFLIALASHGESEPSGRGPVDRRVSDPREVLSLQLMRGDIDEDQYLDEIAALNTEPGNA